MAFESKHEGRTVMTQDGDEVGTIESAHGDTAEVKPSTGLTESIRQRLGWTDEESDTFDLNYSNVDSDDGDEVRLKE